MQSLLRKYFIVRTSWLYGHGRKNFVKSILSLAEQNDHVFGVTDEIGSPTYTADLASGIAGLVREPVYGLYHLSNESNCSRYEYVRKIIELAGKATRVIPVEAVEFQQRYPLPARRPSYSVLANFCARNALGVVLRPWQDALEDFVRSLG